MLLRKHGLKYSWISLRNRMQNINCLTTSMQTTDSGIVNVRQNTKPNAEQANIMQALNIPFNKGASIKKRTQKYYLISWF